MVIFRHFQQSRVVRVTRRGYVLHVRATFVGVATCPTPPRPLSFYYAGIMLETFRIIIASLLRARYLLHSNSRGNRLYDNWGNPPYANVVAQNMLLDNLLKYRKVKLSCSTADLSS